MLLTERYVTIGTIFGVIFLSLSVLAFLNALLIVFGGRSFNNPSLPATIKVAVYALIIGIILLGLSIILARTLLT